MGKVSPLQNSDAVCSTLVQAVFLGTMCMLVGEVLPYRLVASGCDS